MATAANSQKSVRRVRESTNGTLPAGNMLTTLFATFQMSSGIEREQPGNVRSDRLPVDNPATNISPSISATSDFVYGGYDGMLEEVFCGTVTAAVTITPGTTFSFDAASNELRDSGNGLAGIAVGRFIRVSGFTESGNSGVRIGRVSSSAAGALGIDTDWWNGVDEAAGDTVSIVAGAYFQQGTSYLTASYEEWNTASSKGRSMTGVGINSLAIGVPHPNKCTMTWGMVSMGAEESISSQLANGTDAATSNPIINSNVNFGGATTVTSGALGLRWDGTLVPTAKVKNLTWTLENPIQVDGQAGTLGPTVGALDGLMRMSVALSLYRDGAAATETFITDAKAQSTVKSLAFGFDDNLGNLMLFYMPACQPMGEQGPGVSQSGFDMTDFELVCKRDATYGLGRLTIWAAA